MGYILLICSLIFLFPLSVYAEERDRFIEANPLDLAEISALSPFRSCMGHDYSGWNTDGERETNRSMKHYVTQREEVSKAKAIAPFNGKITDVMDMGSQGAQVWIAPNENRRWRFVFFHIDLLAGLSAGSQVKAGQIIGYSNVQESLNFDIALKRFDFFKGPNVFDTPFHHMNENVLEEYTQRGATPENMVIRKDYRDAHPCVFEGSSGPDEQIYLR